MADAPDCTLLFGYMQTACIKTNASLGYDKHGKKITGAPPSTSGSGSSGSSFFGIPLPGSDWWRHFMFRVGEVVIGVTMVIVGVKALATSGDTTKVIVKGAKKVGKQL